MQEAQKAEPDQVGGPLRRWFSATPSCLLRLLRSRCKSAYVSVMVKVATVGLEGF